MVYLQLEPPAEERMEASTAWQNLVLYNRRLREGEPPLELKDLLVDWESHSAPSDPISAEIQREESMVESILAHFG